MVKTINCGGATHVYGFHISIGCAEGLHFSAFHFIFVAPSHSYVCNSMGGPVTASGNMPFELPQSELQKEAGSNVIAIGNITAGTYRHRALLYKVELQKRFCDVVCLLHFFIADLVRPAGCGLLSHSRRLRPTLE